MAVLIKKYRVRCNGKVYGPGQTEGQILTGLSDEEEARLIAGSNGTIERYEPFKYVAHATSEEAPPIPLDTAEKQTHFEVTYVNDSGEKVTQSVEATSYKEAVDHVISGIFVDSEHKQEQKAPPSDDDMLISALDMGELIKPSKPVKSKSKKGKK